MGLLLRQTSAGSAGDHLFLNEDLSDVVVIVKSCGMPWRFPAHSLMLSAQSKVFRCMLENDFSESNDRQITIEDISPTTFERLLRYIYCGKVDIENWKESIDLMKAAHKYQLDPLVHDCGKFLGNVLTLVNVCYIFEESMIYHLDTVKEKCTKLILDAGFIILRSKTFEVLSKESVMEIVTSSDLNIDSELVVFDALLRWAPIQCCRTGKEVTESNILLELQPFLQHLCFDDMSDTDKSALPSSILSCVKPNNLNRITFSVLDSLLQYSHFLDFHIDQSNLRSIRIDINCIRFSIDFPMYLIGYKFGVVTNVIPNRFLLYFVKEGSEDTVIFTSNMTNTSWEVGIHLHGERSYYQTHVLLKQPVKLDEKAVYKIACTDGGQHTDCVKTNLTKDVLCTSSGRMNFTVHSKNIWGLTSLIFL